MKWQLQTAKQRFSELVRLAIDRGPQIVTRHGKDTVVILSVKEYQRLAHAEGDLKAFLFNGPDLSRLEIRRERQVPRAVEL